MDLIAYPIFRTTIFLSPGDLITRKVWRHLSKNKNGILGTIGTAIDLDSINGICWKLNPHNEIGYYKIYNNETKTAIDYGSISIWFYALLTREAAIVRRLTDTSGAKIQRMKVGKACEFFGY
jgi:hypothetical protein